MGNIKDATEYFTTVQVWHDELRLLRELVLGSSLKEDWKWNQPCYTLNGANVVIISAFKSYCALNFFKGALIADERALLVKPGKNTQAGRQMRFTSLADIQNKQSVIEAYIQEAILIEKSGLQIEYKPFDAFEIPKEFKEMAASNPLLNAAFSKLTAGRKKAYMIYFSGAKQSKTRRSRIEGALDRIYKGKGLHDCICGHSKKLPYCDGSHKHV